MTKVFFDNSNWNSYRIWIFNFDFWPPACLISAVLVLTYCLFCFADKLYDNSNNQSFSNFSFCLMSFHFLSLKSQTDMDLNIGCERLFHSCLFLCFLQENNVVVFCSCFVARKTTCCFLVVFYKKNKAQNYYPVYCNNNLWYRRDLV